MTKASHSKKPAKPTKKPAAKAAASKSSPAKKAPIKPAPKPVKGKPSKPVKIDADPKPTVKVSPASGGKAKLRGAGVKSAKP